MIYDSMSMTFGCGFMHK